MNIFVGGIPWRFKEEDMREQFEKFGTVASARVIIDKRTGRSKGYGFVEMPDDEEAKKAIEALHDTEIDGRKIGVTVSEPKKDPEEYKKRDNNRDNRW